jgi:dihydrofolate reductase
MAVGLHLILMKLAGRSWKNSVFFSTLADIEALKNSAGSDIQVHGSGKLIQLLLKHELGDELWLKIHPLHLVKGKSCLTRERSRQSLH